ncbi:MAG: helix-turn-helix transcriptional regulator [Verrucomicrobiales bacterium]|nr:helix-turn-helix transcriptional regulator [Verrucomicrobiales bacterium]
MNPEDPYPVPTHRDLDLNRIELAIHMLSHRQYAVLSWLSHGKTDPEIGEILNLGPETVEQEVITILARMDVESRFTAAARFLYWSFHRDFSGMEKAG